MVVVRSERSYPTKGNYDEARAVLEQLLEQEQSPTNRIDHLTLALAASVTGDKAKANDYLEAAGNYVTLDNDGHFYAALAALSRSSLSPRWKRTSRAR